MKKRSGKWIVAWMVLVAIFVLSSMPVMGDDTASEQMKKVISIVKERIALNDETYVIESYEERTDEKNGVMLYDISWNARSEHDKSAVSVTADGEGNVWEYYSYYGDDERTELSGGKWIEAENAAKAFIERVNPQMASQIQKEDIVFSGGEYRIEFERVHNGIPVQNSCYAYVREKDLSVRSMYTSWSYQAQFPEDALISREQAKDVFQKELGYRLFYYDNTQRADEDDRKVLLMYAPKKAPEYINAITGKVETYENYNEKNMVSDSLASGAVKGEAGDLSPEELALAAEAENLISLQEAEQKVRAVSQFHMTNADKLAGNGLQKMEEDVFWYNLYFQRTEGEDTVRQIHASVDGATGEVVSYRSWRAYEEKDEAEETEAEKTARLSKQKTEAQTLVREQFPNLWEKTEIITELDDFLYISRVENGIPFENNGFRFSFENGEITDFFYTYSDVEVPKPEGVKSLEEAYEVVLSEENFKLFYLPVYPERGVCEMKPVYVSYGDYFSAERLLPLDGWMQEMEEFQIAYTDISGHYAEPAIVKLAENEITLGDWRETAFRPEEGITQKEFLTFLLDNLWGSSRNLYPDAVRLKLLTEDEIAPDKVITRMEGIRYFVRYLDDYDLAEQAHIFADVYTDVKDQDRSYAALAAGYGIVNSTVSELYPENPLRRADAVIMMYNWLKR